ncbi:ABC transporter substrate-binding protein, partial [Streptomyces sp. YC537]|nr:ABC transporter substrate-binding protein [Streptomyces boluensis]
MTPRTLISASPRTAAILAVAASFLLTSCAGSAQSTSVGKNVSGEKIPAEVSADTTLTVGAPDLKVALQLSGQIDKLPFKVKWANISGGPQCSEAFRADALDICHAAEIPSINAYWTGLDTKLVASKFRQDPTGHPIYELGVAPGAGIEKLADLRGKKIAYSPGQAQGALVLRILKKAKLTQKDVELVELASTGDVYPTALGNHQVDAAPLGDVNIKRYLTKYGKDGPLQPPGLPLRRRPRRAPRPHRTLPARRDRRRPGRPDAAARARGPARRRQ